MNTIKRKYGWIHEPKDPRDYLLAAVMRIPVDLPKMVDLRPGCSKVEDQGELGSCTANALVGALEFLEIKDKVPTFTDLSRLFVYFNERDMEGTTDEDSGAMIRDGIKSLARLGVCSEKDWPYDTNDFTERPTTACYQEALNHQIKIYAKIVGLQQMRAVIAKGFPFVFGIPVYESFEAPEVAATGIVPYPDLGNEQQLGGHALCCVGYDDEKKLFIVRNSWSPEWGIKGYCYIPYKYLVDMASDCWFVSRLEE